MGLCTCCLSHAKGSSSGGPVRAPSEHKELLDDPRGDREDHEKHAKERPRVEDPRARRQRLLGPGPQGAKDLHDGRGQQIPQDLRDRRRQGRRHRVLQDVLVRPVGPPPPRVPAAVQNVTYRALEHVAGHLERLVAAVARHHLHETAVVIEDPVDPVVLDDQGEGLVVHPARGIHGHVAARAAARQRVALAVVVLRYAPVDSGGRDPDHGQVRERRHYGGHAAAEAVAREDDLAVLVAGELRHAVDQVHVAPRVGGHVQCVQEVVDAHDDHFHRASGPHSDRREDRGEDAQGHGLRPHPDVLDVVADPRRVGAPDREHEERPRHAGHLELHLDPAQAARAAPAFAGFVEPPPQPRLGGEDAVQEVREAGV
mmetsp:Transcript_128417/g.363404  ORF Transcript_128417/g.363404 Transcript_128417/m.363404 type:complete len:370 (+) Transcript_128417:43-1152(+)